MLEFDEKETKSEPRNTRSPKQITRSPIHIMENLRYKSKSKNLFMTHEGPGKKISENINHREKRPKNVRLLKLKLHQKKTEDSN